tara:strand:+ start:413 stop:637 length:225 start_codon:yes stop_codon:yes gene_type:complete
MYFVYEILITTLIVTFLFFLWYFTGIGLERYFNYLKTKEVGYVRNRLAILALFLAALIAPYIDNLFSFTDLLRR